LKQEVFFDFLNTSKKTDEKIGQSLLMTRTGAGGGEQATVAALTQPAIDKRAVLSTLRVRASHHHAP
jgi:hypothetical protein